MADQNAEAGGTPVLCEHDELMRAVWGDEPMHTRLELARLVWELRRELRRFGAEDLVESERGRGYRLGTCPAG
jgi:DNA-binding winged helix-turn-helix (wHTH) protein